MSIALPTVDLTGATVGTTGSISLANVGLTADPSLYNRPPIMQLFNDSGCGLRVTTKTEGDTFYVPAGAWRTIALTAGEAEIDYSVVYVLANPPVSTLMAVYYRPGELVDSVGTLGNSPIGGGTSVSGNTLSNEANAANFEVIDAGVPGNTKLLDIFNDHFIWKILQSGVVHQVLKGQTSGNALQLGQAGDIIEVLGQLLIDQIATVGPTPPPTGTGTVTIYEFTIGAFKLVVIQESALKNTSASTFSMTLPTAFTSTCWIKCGDHGGFELQHSGTSINIDVISSLGAGANSGVTSETRMFSGNIGYAPVNSAGVDAPFETVLFEPGNVTSHTGISFIVGV